MLGTTRRFCHLNEISCTILYKNMRVHRWRMLLYCKEVWGRRCTDSWCLHCRNKGSFRFFSKSRNHMNRRLRYYPASICRSVQYLIEPNPPLAPPLPPTRVSVSRSGHRVPMHSGTWSMRLPLTIPSETRPCPRARSLFEPATSGKGEI